MECKRQAVISAWECVKFGHSGARCHFSPSCDPGSFPAILLIPALICWCKHTAIAGHVAPRACQRWGKVPLLPKHLAESVYRVCVVTAATQVSELLQRQTEE